jgi:hypothetical protein
LTSLSLSQSFVDGYARNHVIGRVPHSRKSQGASAAISTVNNAGRREGSLGQAYWSCCCDGSRSYDQDTVLGSWGRGWPRVVEAGWAMLHEQYEWSLVLCKHEFICYASNPRRITGMIIGPIEGFIHWTIGRTISRLLCYDRVETCTLLRDQCDHVHVARYPSKGSNNKNSPRSDMTSLRPIPTAVFTVSLETGLLSAFSDSAVR